MKIQFLADVPLAKPTSGSEQVLYQQALGCAQAGMEIFAITRHAGPPMDMIRDVGGVREGTYDASAGKPFRAVLSVFMRPLLLYHEFAKKGPFKAVVIHQPFTCLPLLLAGKLKDIPKIYVSHSPSHEEYILSPGKNPEFGQLTLPAPAAQISLLLIYP
jgi:hypothetical protein